MLPTALLVLVLQDAKPGTGSSAWGTSLSLTHAAPHPPRQDKSQACSSSQYGTAPSPRILSASDTHPARGQLIPPGLTRAPLPTPCHSSMESLQDCTQHPTSSTWAHPKCCCVLHRIPCPALAPLRVGAGPRSSRQPWGRQGSAKLRTSCLQGLFPSARNHEQDGGWLRAVTVRVPASPPYLSHLFQIKASFQSFRRRFFSPCYQMLLFLRGAAARDQWLSTCPRQLCSDTCGQEPPASPRSAPPCRKRS